jgi:flagellar biosynthesis protein FlhF
MRLKTYRAASMADALSLVKKDLGKDAVILHTRAYKVGAILGFGGRPQVEVTATVGVNTATPRMRKALGPGGGAGAESLPAGRSAVARAYGVTAQGPQMEVKAPEPVAVERKATVAPVAPVAEVARIAVQAAAEPARLAPVGVNDEQLRAELASIKRMVGQVLQGERAGAMGPGALRGTALVEFYSRLIEAEVAREVADELAQQVRAELTPDELGHEHVVRGAMLARLAGLMPASEPALPTGARGRPCTVALIGPTGVGKTTTVAKLAAAHKLRHGRRVGLVTCDTYRIAAVEQLRTYASIIGVPLKVVLTPGEMAQACEQLRDCDVILVDTAGRAPGDAARLDELRAFLRAAQPDQTHLVLSSVAGPSSLLHAAERFSELRPDHLIFTKLDEAVSFGGLVNASRKVRSLVGGRAKLSYVTTGQEVPDDIEPSRPERLARLVLDGAGAQALALGVAS